MADRVVVLLMFLLPIPNFLGSIAARGADAMRFGAVSGHLLLSPKQSWGKHVWRASALLLLMFVFACISLAYGISHSLRDWLDVFRIAAFWTVFVLGASLARRGGCERGAVVEFARLILLIGMLNALFTVGQYLFPGMTRPLQTLYTAGDLQDLRMDMISEQGRAIGFFGNPNTNAVMLLLLALPSAALFQLTSRKQYLVIGLSMLGMVLLTASRTGLVLSGVSIALLCIASRRWAYLAVLTIAAVGGYAFLDFVVRDDIVRDWFPYLSEFVVKVHNILNGDQIDLESIHSFRARLAIWDRSMDWYHASPVLGSGPLREVIPSFADNYYIYLLSRYGGMGLALYACFNVYVAGLSIRAVLTGRTPLSQWGTLSLVSLVVVNIANYTIDAFLIVPIGSICLLYAGYMTSLADLDSLAATSMRMRRRGRHAMRVLPSHPSLHYYAARQVAKKAA